LSLINTKQCYFIQHIISFSKRNCNYLCLRTLIYLIIVIFATNYEFVFPLNNYLDENLYLFFLFFFYSKKPHYLESEFHGSRWTSKTLTVTVFYKRCMSWLELETYYANLKFFLSLHPSFRDDKNLDPRQLKRFQVRLLVKKIKNKKSSILGESKLVVAFFMNF
jgi:hypothetical protein